MPRSKIREVDTKRLLRKFVPEFDSELKIFAPAVQVTEEKPLKKQLEANPWLKEKKLVAKPDMLFGQRGKHNLLALNKTADELIPWLEERVGKEIDTGKLKGVLTHFIVEPFCPHKEEYYMSMQIARDTTTVTFSPKGGVEIESNWDALITWEVPFGSDITDFNLEDSLKKSLPADRVVMVAKVLRATFKAFEKLDFTFLEWNPWTFSEEGTPVVLDCRGEVDNCATFTTAKYWYDEEKKADLEMPAPFGKVAEPEEAQVSAWDAKTGASLKLTIMNRLGRIWSLVAGGGASVIYADTVADHGYGAELGNYGEYSGGPNEEETFKYARTVLRLLIESAELETKETGKPPQRRVLLIGGGIANFTDVAKTFKGIVHALKEVKEELIKSNCRIYVRRAGPNYKLGLSIMRKLGEELGVKIEVYGPEVPLTHIVPLAINWLEKKK